MTDIVSQYKAASSDELPDVLTIISNTTPPAYTAQARTELSEILLHDLNSFVEAHAAGRLSRKSAPLAITALKALGRNPDVSRIFATQENQTLLLTISRYYEGEDMNSSNEALKVVANALLLAELGRTTWVTTDVGGGDWCIDVMEKSTSPERIFLASRILFLCTASSFSSGAYICYLIETKRTPSGGNVVDLLGSKLESLVADILGGIKMSKEAMTDLLKFIFNLLVHYPKLAESEPQTAEASNTPGQEDKVMGDFWNNRLDGLLPPLLRVFYALPPSFPAPIAAPLTHIIHSLITIPITSTLHKIWFPSPSSSRSGSPIINSPRISTSKLPTGSSGSSPVSTSRPSTPGSSGTKEPKPSAIDRTLSAIAAGRRSLSSRSSSPPQSPTSSNPDILQRAYDLLEVTLAHYMPGTTDPDESSVREMVKRESSDNSSLDDLAVPLVVLIMRLCGADTPSRTRMREWILPANLDRTSALELRADMLGRLLRLLGTVYHPRMKDAVGEMLFVICNSDASVLSSQVGYGNVAGFLYNKGIMTAPPPPAGAPSSSSPSSPDSPGTTSADSPEINPITGTVQEKTELPDMTDEEKEREAEKLFVLFDRLERTGALPPSQNPIRKAVQEGKLG